MKIGYARVSTSGQHLDTQIGKLTAFECKKIYEEKQSGKDSNHRPVLQDALKFAREGDTFVITRLDRLARSLLDLIKITESFEKQGISFVVLDQKIDTTTPTGRFMFHVLSAIGEFERDLINERTKEGIANTKERGVQFGRKSKLTPEQLVAFQCEFENPPDGVSKADIAKKHGLSRATGYRVCKE